MIAGVVLAGSHVWRAGSLEALCPRALLPVVNKPLIDYVLEWLRQGGVTTVTICANDGAAALQAYLGDGAAAGLSLYYYHDRVPRGPAGCARDASLASGADHLVLVDAALIPRMDLRGLLAEHVASGAAFTKVVHRLAAQPLLNDGERRHATYVPTGVRVFTRQALAVVPPSGFHDIKEWLVPQLRSRGEDLRVHVAELVSPAISGLEAYFAVQGWMLDRMRLDEIVPRGYEVRDDAFVHHSCQIAKSSRLIGPVMVGPRTRIEEEALLVGPSVLGAGCVVGRRTLLARSILWNGAVVSPGARIDQSLVATHATVEVGEEIRCVICTRSATETAHWANA